jgi:hypothetical protein
MASLVPFGQGVSGEKICLTLANQKQELLLAAIFVGQAKRNEETLLLLNCLAKWSQTWQEASM